MHIPFNFIIYKNSTLVSLKGAVSKLIFPGVNEKIHPI